MCKARDLQCLNASCVCREGRRTTTFFLSSNINPITTKLKQVVSSSWAYLPYSPRIMGMPKDIRRKGNPKRLNNPRANYKPS